MTKSPYFLSLLILLIALAIRTTTLGNTFIVNDETLYWDWSNRFLRALINLDFHGTLVGKGYPSITIFWVHGLGLLLTALIKGQAVAHEWLNNPLIFTVLGQRRIVMGAVNALLFVPIFWQSRRLMGDSLAFWGTAGMAVAPFLVADARTMRGDALMCSLMLISVLGWLLFLREQRYSHLILSAIAFGLAFLTKVTAIPIVGFVILATTVYLFRRPDKALLPTLRWGLSVIIGWGALGGLTIFLFWPALWVAPLEVLAFMSQYADDSIDGRLNFFWGQLTHSEPLHLFYPNAFLFRATPFMVIGCLIITIRFAVYAYQQARQRPAPRPFPPTLYWTLLALLAYCVIYTLTLDFGALKRDRYLMPIFPATALIAAAGWLWLIQVKPRAKIVVALLLTLELAHILSTHPYYYTYWSPLMGGGRVAEYAMMAESGVDSEPFVTLNEHPNAAQETIAILTTRDYRPAYIGKTVRLLNNDEWITANYVVLRQYHYQTEKFDPDILTYLYRHPATQTVTYQGYTWAWVYPGPAAQFYAGNELAGKALLFGYNLDQTPLSPDHPARLKLFWQQKGIQPDESILVRLVDESGFAWLTTQATPLPDFQTSLTQTGAIIESEAMLTPPPGTPPGRYFLKIAVANETLELGQFELPATGNQLTITNATRLVELPAAHPIQQTVNAALKLVAQVRSETALLTPQNPLTMTFYWQALAPIQPDLKLTLTLQDEANKIWATWPHQPTHDLYPPSQWQPNELIRDPFTLALSQTIPSGQYQLLLNNLNLGTITVTDRLRLMSAPTMQHPLIATFDKGISLQGYDIKQEPLTGAALLTLKLYWQTQQSIAQNYTVFVQLLGPNGQVVGQHDSPPMQGNLPTNQWDIGEFIPDPHQFQFATNQKGEYRLIVGLYVADTGQRLSVTNGGDFVPLTTFNIQ